MSVLIKDMEMPDGCFHCILSFMWFNGTETVLQCNVLKKLVSDDGSKDPDCPLTEIPQHGRLIDADFVSKVLKKGAAEEWNQHTAPFSWSYAYECLNDTVGLIPTVIPADKDGET